MSTIDQPVAVVTEHGQRISAATARRLVDDGYRVLASDANACPSASGDVDLFRANLALAADARQLSEAALARYGCVDVLVLGPPPAPDGCLGQAALRAGTEALLPWTNGLAAFLPALEQSRGRVVSIVGSTGRYRSGYFRAHATNRATAAPEALAHSAVLGLTRQLALELAPKGVRLNAVVAGPLEGGDELQGMDEQERRFVLEQISLGRLGRPEEVAAVAAFLASSASRYLTGSAIDVNGGWWMS